MRACSMTILGIGLVGCGGTGPVEGDLSCLGAWTAPEEGEEVTLTYTVQDRDGVVVPEAVVHLFRDDVVTEGCEAPCEVLVADAEGQVEITAPSGWLGYRVVGEPAELGNKRRMNTVEVHSPHPPLPGEEAFLNAIARNSMGAVFSLGGAGKVDDTQGIVVGRGVDCMEESLANLHPRVFDAEGAAIEDLADAYLNNKGSCPARGRKGTPEGGQAFVANLPPGGVRFELWGSPEGDDLEQLYACENVPVFADTVTTIRMRPLRSDGPPACL
ncbi:MAG: hypothetical protein KTR31_00205 [Myxococcales bacterium]|nr:hypothetical protein [Myxococcales bacterium]